MRYRHKPTVIEAFQWTGGPDQQDDPVWAAEAIEDGRIQFVTFGSEDTRIIVNTPEGVMSGKPGVWITKGIHGELYVVQPELFEQLYEFDADGVLDTWAGNWIVRIDAPNGMYAEHMLDRSTMEQLTVPAESIVNTAVTLFGDLWRRRHEEKPNG